MLITNQYYWLLDYGYVARKQFAAAVSRTKAERYRNPHAHQTSIILIPGIYERWQFMQPIADLLRRHNYDVHVLEGLGFNRHGIEEMAAVVKDYIDASDINQFIVIAHSKGGLIGKYLLANFNDRNTIKGMIALNTPFSGSRYAYLFLLFKSLRIFIPNSSILRGLAKNQTVNQSIISIYGTFDPHIPGGSRLEGARNIQLPTRGHFRIMSDPRVQAAILENIARLQ